MRLTHFTDYGLRVLMYLASRDGDCIPTAEIAKRFAVSEEHLVKVVRRLSELGYVEPKRGPHGGIRLLPATREVTVGEVVRNLEPQVLVECFDAMSSSCPIASICGLAPLLRRAATAFMRELDEVSVGELTPRSAQLRMALGGPPKRKARRSRGT